MDASALRANRRVWDEMGPSFDATRDRPWAPVVDFLSSLPRGTRLLDAGCGNGRHTSVALDRGLTTMGFDVSAVLLRAAARRAPGGAWLLGALEAPPLRTKSFDAAICIAAMHHVRGRDHRVAAWGALRRSVQGGARMLASAWSTQAEAARGPRLLGGPTAEPGDAMVEWGALPSRPQRFVHFYAEGELQAELAAAGWAVDRAWDVGLTGAGPDNRFVLARAPEA